MTGVTQGDRDRAAGLLDEISALIDHVGIGQVADLIRDGEYDEHEATLAFAAHRIAAIEEQREEEAEALAVQYAQARATAIEECAKVAEQTTSCAITNYVHGKAIATAIRNLSGEKA